MSKPQQTTTDKDTSTSLPGWLTSASQGAAGLAGSLPTYTPYSGQGVAGLTPDQIQALTAASGNAGAGQSIAAQGLPAWMAGMNFSAPQLTSGDLNSSVSGLMSASSPYTQSVIDATNAQLDKGTAQAQNSTDDSLAAQHAFGGDRQAIADADVQNQGAMTKASTDAGLNQSAYSQALQTALSAGQGNQAAAVNSAGVNLGAASGLSNLGTSISGMNASDLQSLLAAGGVQQQTNQAGDTFNYGEYQNVYNSQYQQAQTLAQILGMLPHDTTGTETDTSTQYTNPLLGIAGLGLGIAGLGTGGGATLGGTAVKSLLG